MLDHELQDDALLLAGVENLMLKGVVQEQRLTRTPAARATSAAANAEKRAAIPAGILIHRSQRAAAVRALLRTVGPPERLWQAREPNVQRHLLHRTGVLGAAGALPNRRYHQAQVELELFIGRPYMRPYPAVRRKRRVTSAQHLARSKSMLWLI